MATNRDLGMGSSRQQRGPGEQKADATLGDTTKSDFPTGSAEELADIAFRRDRLFYQSMGDTARFRRLSDLTIIHYDPQLRLCNVVQNRGRFLSTMGVPISGGHKLHPEEAVFLMESNSACIRVNDVAISIQQAYRLLLEMNAVSWADYAVYTHLKRAGYIVLPFRPPITDTHNVMRNTDLKRMKLSESEDVEAKKLKDNTHAALASCESERRSESPVHLPFPSRMLDMFPDNHGSTITRLPSVDEWQRFLPQGIRPAASDKMVVDCQAFASKPADMAKRTNKAQRSDPPWISLRPRHWAPLPRNISSRESWTEFKDQKQRWIAHKLRKSVRHVNSAFLPQQRAEHTMASVSTPFRVRYDVHLPGSNYCHSSPPTPNHRLVVIDVHRSGMPTPIDLEQLKQTAGDHVPLHLAACDTGQIAFYNADMIMVPNI